MATSQALIALGDIKYGKSVFKRIGNSEFTVVTAVQPPESTPEPDDSTDHSGGGSSSKYIYLTVTGMSGEVMYKRNKVSIGNNDTPYSVLVKAIDDVETSGKGDSLYVKAINGLREFDGGAANGWKYTVNGVEIQQSAAKHKLKDKDEVHWCFYEGNQPGSSTSSKPKNSKDDSIEVVTTNECR